MSPQNQFCFYDFLLSNNGVYQVTGRHIAQWLISPGSNSFEVAHTPFQIVQDEVHDILYSNISLKTRVGIAGFEQPTHVPDKRSILLNC